jgi:hypothetical protein
MKRLLSFLTCFLLIASPLTFLGAGCAPAGAVTGDPVVINSERAIGIAFDTVDGFLRWEHQNRAAIPPKVHAVAQSLRRDAPDAFRNARAVLRAYKSNRSPEQKALLDTWLATLSELARVATEASAR